jgi:carbon-monoxide dehydrogenase small subunit
MIMAAKALLGENSSPTVDEIRMYLSGNLWRCTVGYAKIVTSVLVALDDMKKDESHNTFP